jgi:DNA repair protein RadC
MAHLSDAALVTAIAGRRSTSKRVAEAIAAPPPVLDAAHYSSAELAHCYGLTPSGTRRLVAAMELHRRIQQAERPPRNTVRKPEDVAEMMAPLANLDHERLWCLALDVRSSLIGEPLLISVGDVDGTDAGPRSFFRMALRTGAVSVIAVHNHPSGAVQPSQADLAVTKRLVASGATLDLPCVDHVFIAAGDRFTSIRRQRQDLFTALTARDSVHEARRSRYHYDWRAA